MSLDPDLLLDRQRLKRRLAVWQVVAVLAVAAAALALVGLGRGGAGGPRVARVNIHGLITEDRALLRAIAALAKDARVRAVLIDIDSPGGSVAGGESLYRALQRVAEAKPTVAVMHGTAASAGYMVALPAARIFARQSTLTGSIGVILQTGEVSGLLDRLGITAEAITSGPLKGEPSPTRPLSPAGREVLRGIVADMYDQFVAMVAAGRHMSVDRVHGLADGRAYTGRQALGLGLIDEIGGEAEARAWLAAQRQVPEAVPAHDLRSGRRFDPMRLLRPGSEGAVGEWFASLLGAWWPDLRSLAPGAWAVWRGGTGPGSLP